MEYRKKCYVNENWKTAFRKDPEELPPEQEDEWVTADLPHNWEEKTAASQRNGALVSGTGRGRFLYIPVVQRPLCG